MCSQYWPLIDKGCGRRWVAWTHIYSEDPKFHKRNACSYLSERVVDDGEYGMSV